MARPLRISFPGAWYHVTNRGLERRAVFREPDDASRFHDLLAQVADRFGFEFHAFCLMGNHYHLLVRTPRANLSEGMRLLDGAYTQRFNRRHGRDGPLFRGRFGAVLVQADRHLVCAARYIHLNPVEAGLVERPEDWPRSSYRAYLDPRLAPGWLRTGVVLGWFGGAGARARHREFVEQGLDAPTREFFARRRRPPVLGSEVYRDALAASLEDVATVAPDDMPDAERVGTRPSLAAIADAVAAAFEVDVANLAVRPGRSPAAVAMARGALVEIAVRAGGWTTRRVAAWLGYSRANVAANAARRFREAIARSADLRERTSVAMTGLCRAGRVGDGVGEAAAIESDDHERRTGRDHGVTPAGQRFGLPALGAGSDDE